MLAVVGEAFEQPVSSSKQDSLVDTLFIKLLLPQNETEEIETYSHTTICS